jgi:hypothetical protein
VKGEKKKNAKSGVSPYTVLVLVLLLVLALFFLEVLENKKENENE